MPNQRRKDFTPAKNSDPNFKSGGRSRHPNSLANLKKWKPGESGNLSGKPSAINEIMRLARSHCAEAVETLVSIMRDESTPPREKIASCVAIMDRGMGRPVVPVFKGTANGFPSDMIGDVGADGLTPLLRAAGKDASGEYKATLQAELRRIEDEERVSREARRNAVDRAAAKLANGEAIEDPAMRMLATVATQSQKGATTQ
jgi:hypothetical protein